jgi:hypothetical protein
VGYTIVYYRLQKSIKKSLNPMYGVCLKKEKSIQIAVFMSYDYRRTQHCVGNGPSQPPAHSI